MDHDVSSDDEIGLAVTTVSEILAAGGKQELSMLHKDNPIEGKLSVSCKFFHFAAEGNSLSASDHSNDGLMCGVATVLVAGVFDIPGNRKGSCYFV